MGWIADLFRTAWGLVYWNLRKSLYRARRGQSRCPCQTPSDSGRAWETGCEASIPWNRRVRFRRVCPLLKPGPDGSLRCSVNAEDVRPFWGRAFAIYGSAAFGAYLLAAILGFAVLRGIGYKVTPWTLAWPPAWSTLRTVRSEYFLEKARVAYNEQRINEAILALSLAYELDPHNHAAGLLLAQLWQVGQATLSDRTYVRLLDNHPAMRPGTAQSWYRALLARGDFRTIAQLSADALRFDPDHATAWIHALFFSIRKTGDLAPLHRALMVTTPDLAPEVRALLELERTVSTSLRTQGIDALLQPASDLGTAYAAYYRINRLLQLDAPQQALTLFERYGPRLGERERAALQLDLYAELGWAPLRRATVETLVARPLNLPTVEILMAHLIRYPSPELARIVFDGQAAHPLPPTEVNYSGYTALFCTAGIYGDEEQVKTLAAALKQISGSSFASLRAAEAFFRQPEANRRIEAVLPMLQPLPLDVTYALLERFGRSLSPATQP